MYRVAQKSVNLNHFLVLRGMFGFKSANQCIEQYNTVVSCTLNMDDLISNNVCEFIVTYFSVYFTLQLTDFSGLSLFQR
jgi:hypothetical protein